MKSTKPSGRNLIRSTKTLAIILSILTTCSCSVLSDTIGTGLTNATKRANSFETKKETVVIDAVTDHVEGSEAVGPSDLVDSGSNQENRLGPAGAALETVVAAYLVGEIEKGVSNAAGNYSVIYSGTLAGPNLVGVRGFSMQRLVDSKTGASITFLFNKSGKSAYTIRLAELELARAKSAVPFWDDDVDMVVKLTLSVLGQEKTAAVADSEFKVKNVKIGEKNFYGPKDYNHRTGWFRIPEPKDGDVIPYVLTVTVQETSDFYKTAEKGKALVGEKKETWTKKLTEALGGE